MNAWLKRCVFNLDLNRESMSEPRIQIWTQNIPVCTLCPLTTHEHQIIWPVTLYLFIYVLLYFSVNSFYISVNFKL